MAIIDVVKFNGLATRDWIVYKHYAEDLSAGTQLIVAEGQVAVFLKGGQVCDVFGPGTYTLSTMNLPILSKIINIPFGNKTPFSAEIYYINSTTKLDLSWGTSDPIQLVDPKYHIRLRIRAFGQVGLKISDYTLFIQELIGSMNQSEVINYEKVLGFYKGFLISKIKSLIAQIIIEEQISALEISAKLNDISERISPSLSEDFERFGMKLVNFYVKSINFPEDDFEKINNILEDKAAFEIMGDSRYAVKRSFDVYEGAANNQNGVAGAFAAGGIGLGAGVAIGSNSAAMQNVMSTPAASDVYCPECNTANKANAKFCSQCGMSLVPKKPETIKCAKCGAEISKDSKFCNICGQKVDTRIICECGNEIKSGTKFCSSCGRKVDE